MRAKRGGLPQRVKVGHLTYSIEEMDRKTAERADIFGDVQHAEGSIRVKAGMAPGFTAETLIHEIMHTIFDEWEIRMPVAEEEKLVAPIARGLATVMRDNPELVKWLMRQLAAPAA